MPYICSPKCAEGGKSDEQTLRERDNVIKLWEEMSLRGSGRVILGS